MVRRTAHGELARVEASDETESEERERERERQQDVVACVFSQSCASSLPRLERSSTKKNSSVIDRLESLRVGLVSSEAFLLATSSEDSVIACIASIVGVDRSSVKCIALFYLVCLCCKYYDPYTWFVC